MLRIAKNLQRKEKNRQQVRGKKPKNFNPFLPPEPELTVTDLTDTHLALLNKFNVVGHHLLIITRRFEDQETLLNQDDFQALWPAMREYEAQGFYNGGEVAGASQRHKHLQMIPLPMAENGQLLPVDAIIREKIPLEGIATIPGLPFNHRLVQLDDTLYRDPARAAAKCYQDYRMMLEALNMSPVMREGKY